MKSKQVNQWIKAGRLSFNHAVRISSLCLLAVCCTISANGDSKGITIKKENNIFHSAPPLVLLPGCITSGNQSINSGNIPATIIATAASQGSCGTSYLYQWQSSTDSIYFSNVPGATSQNLSFSATLPQTTWFQRRATCASEVKYTNAIKITVGPGT